MAGTKTLVKVRCKYCYQSNDNLYGLLLWTIANNELKVMFPTWQLSNIHCPLIVQIKHIDTDTDTDTDTHTDRHRHRHTHTHTELRQQPKVSLS